MKNYRLLIPMFIGLIIVSIAFTGCKEDEPKKELPEVSADFTFTNDQNTLVVAFTNASENAESYSWDFGDNSEASIEENPTHTYATSGTYQVTLIATGEGGETKSVTKEVIVSQEVPALTVGFTFVADGLIVTFTNISENGVSYSWDFGDGSPASTDQHPTHTYAASGTYTVTLTAEGQDGSESDTQEVTVIEVFEPAPGDVYDFFTGDEGGSNIQWNLETAITLESGIDFEGEKVGKYTRSATEGSQYDKVYIRPLPDDVVWTERTVFSIEVYFPSTNAYSEDRSTGITKNVELRLRKDKEDGSGSDSNSEIRLIKEVSSLDEWVTIEFDMSEAAHWSGDPTFDANAPYTTLVMMLGRDGGLFAGEFYLKNFKRL